MILLDLKNQWNCDLGPTILRKIFAERLFDFFFIFLATKLGILGSII